MTKSGRLPTVQARRSIRGVVMLVAIASLAVFPMALAMAAGAESGAGHGGGHADGHSAAAWNGLGFTFVNFTIFVILMVRFTRVPLADFLSGRRKELVEAMSAAAKAKEEADKIKAEYEAKAAGLEQERRSLVAELTEIAEKDRARALAAAAQAAERLLADADRTAVSDLERAKRELRAEAARLAAELACSDLQSRLTSTDHSRLVGDFLEEVGGRQGGAR